ncbi:MAG TPA: thioesterase family protein [Anaeromyxobacteraceae bacterium]|nr:thioesterase family protein [Anaeromyxobacteraceae bacterium]
MAEKVVPRRHEYPFFGAVSARWMDNDVYGHVNNAHYYSYFDSVVNEYLVRRGGLDIFRGPVVGYVVASSCAYFKPVAYPATLELGLRAERLGRSSVQYGLGVFLPGDDLARAAGTVVHVFVERETSKPTPLPPRVREALEAIERGPPVP